MGQGRWKSERLVHYSSMASGNYRGLEMCVIPRSSCQVWLPAWDRIFSSLSPLADFVCWSNCLFSRKQTLSCSTFLSWKLIWVADIDKVILGDCWPPSLLGVSVWFSERACFKTVSQRPVEQSIPLSTFSLHMWMLEQLASHKEYKDVESGGRWANAFLIESYIVFVPTWGWVIYYQVVLDGGE